jgi:hypothetical protein
MYCFLLKRMQLTSTTGEESFNTPYDVWQKTYNMSLLLRDFLYSSPNLLGVLFTASLNPGWFTALTTQNTTEIIVFCHKHRMQLHFTSMYVALAYFSYWSWAKDGLLSPA